eukprot:2573687-Pyramimonas_sp.AAC.1
MAHAVRECSRVQFQKTFLQCDENACLRFWANLHGHMPYLPTTELSDDELRRTIPILYHVDGAE